MDFDYLNYLTSTKLKKVNSKNVKPVKSFDTENKFLNPIYMCSQNKIHINPIYIWLDGKALSKRVKKQINLDLLQLFIL